VPEAVVGSLSAPDMTGTPTSGSDLWSDGEHDDDTATPAAAAAAAAAERPFVMAVFELRSMKMRDKSVFGPKGLGAAVACCSASATLPSEFTFDVDVRACCAGG
jgi:hypothetical protein